LCKELAAELDNVETLDEEYALAQKLGADSPYTRRICRGKLRAEIDGSINKLPVTVGQSNHLQRM